MKYSYVKEVLKRFNMKFSYEKSESLTEWLFSKGSYSIHILDGNLYQRTIHIRHNSEV